MPLKRGLAVAAVATLSLTAPARAARPVTFDDPPAAPVITRPLLVDQTATLALSGRAKPRAAVDIQVSCSLRPCVTQATANKRGRWRARLHVIVPARRTTVTILAGYPLAPPEAETEIQLAPPAPTTTTTGSPEFVLIGDSLAQGIEPHLPEFLPGWRITSDAAKSRFMLAGMAIRDTMRKPRSRPVVLAFSLFTNDHPSRAAELAQSVRESLAGLPPGSCAVWATIARPRVNGVSYAEANRVIEEAAAEDARLLVVPWAAAVRANRGWLRPDRVHATPEGYRARAAMYAEAARSCPPGDGQPRSGRSG